jgi:hypothetical protein
VYLIDSNPTLGAQDVGSAKRNNNKQREFSNFELIVKNVIVTSINTYNDDHERRQRAKNLVENIGEGLKNLSK